MNHVRIIDTKPRAAPDVEESRRVEFTISTNARDSHHTILNQNAWDLTRYNRNGIVGFDHAVWGGNLCGASDPDVALGPGRAWVENAGTNEARLIGEWTAEPRDINELAERIFRKVLFGTLKATSVGFRDVGVGRWGDGDEAEGAPRETYYFAGQELFEWSIVFMGSNPETVKRSLNAQTRAAIEYVRAHVPELSTRDVLNMTVRDVLEAVDGKPVKAAFTSTTRAERRQPLEEFVRDSLHVSEAFRAATARINTR